MSLQSKKEKLASSIVQFFGKETCISKYLQKQKKMMIKMPSSKNLDWFNYRLESESTVLQN